MSRKAYCQVKPTFRPERATRSAQNIFRRWWPETIGEIMALKLGQFPSLDEKGALTARISKRITWCGRLFTALAAPLNGGLTSFVFHSHSHRSNARQPQDYGEGRTPYAMRNFPLHYFRSRPDCEGIFDRLPSYAGRIPDSSAKFSPS